MAYVYSKNDQKGHTLTPKHGNPIFGGAKLRKNVEYNNN